MTLIVSDATGRRYRPTGQFREPEHGEFLYCFDHKRVERRAGAQLSDIPWCDFAHVEFLLHRIICEPVPVEYEVTVRLTADEFNDYRQNGAMWTPAGRVLNTALRAGNYREVSRDAS